MNRELSDEALVVQLQAFMAYHERGGLSLEGWLRSKDFAAGDAEWLRRALDE